MCIIFHRSLVERNRMGSLHKCSLQKCALFQIIPTRPPSSSDPQRTPSAPQAHPSYLLGFCNPRVFSVDRDTGSTESVPKLSANAHSLIITDGGSSVSWFLPSPLHKLVNQPYRSVAGSVMTLDLSGKTALVTGATSGIGRCAVTHSHLVLTVVCFGG